MTETITVHCDCHHSEEIIIESEACGEGSEHEYHCPNCNWITLYEIVYNIDTHNLSVSPPV